MKSQIEKFSTISDAVKASIAYTIANLFTKGLSIVATPIYTRLMSPEQIGVVTTFTSWSMIINVFATLTLTSGGFSIAMVEYPNRRNEYISSIFGLSFLSASICLGIYLSFSSYINELLGLTTYQMMAMLCAFLVVPCTNYWICKQRYEFKFKSVLIITIAQSFLTLISSILTVIVAKKAGNKNLGEIRTIAMNVIPITFGFVFAVIVLIKGKKVFDKGFWLFSLKINLPLMVHSLAKHVFDVSDRLMIDKLRGKSEVGIYGTLYGISSISLIVWNSINASLVPLTFEKLKAKHEYELKNVITVILLFYAIFASLITLFAPEIIRILTTKVYYNAVYMMPPVAAGIYLTSLYNVYSNVILYTKKTWMIMISTMISSVVNITLNYWLIPSFGYIAAAYTTLGSYVLLTILIICFTKYIFHKRFCNDKLVIIISIVSILSMQLCNLLYDHIIFRYLSVILLVVLFIILKNKILQTIKIFIRKEDSCAG